MGMGITAGTTPVPESLAASEDRVYQATNDTNTNPQNLHPATNEISHPLLRAMFNHWDQCPKERRERYVQFLQIHTGREDLDTWTETSFQDFEHFNQVLILGAIACCCSDLFHAMVKRGVI